MTDSGETCQEDFKKTVFFFLFNVDLYNKFSIAKIIPVLHLMI